MLENELAITHATVTFANKTWFVITAQKSAVERDRESVRVELERTYGGMSGIAGKARVDFEDETADFDEEDENETAH